MSLLGGYAGLGADDPNARDFELYETILDGDLAGDDAEVMDAALLYDDTTRTENTWKIVQVIGHRVRVEGSTITGARCSGVAVGRGASDTTVRHCLFYGNRGHKGDSNPSGGALTSYGDGVHIARCEFKGNAGGLGAVVFWSRGHLEDCVFTENYSWDWGGAGYLHEGGSLTDCRFVKNRALASGGALYFFSGDYTLSHCVFRGNVSGSGGGALACNGFAAITDSLFAGNEAGTRGGGCIHWDGFATVVNCIFAGNRAGGVGGAWSSRWGSSVAMVNCTALGNRASEGGFLAVAYTNESHPSEATVSNCVLCDGDTVIHWDDEVTVNVSHSCICGGMSVLRDGEKGLVQGKGNIVVDPCFVDPGYWDVNGTQDDPNDDIFVEGDYHLKSQAGRWDEGSESWVCDDVTSPCIDAGDPNTPVMHEPFPNGGVINMGAYGGTAQASKSYFSGPPCETIGSKSERRRTNESGRTSVSLVFSKRVKRDA